MKFKTFRVAAVAAILTGCVSSAALNRAMSYPSTLTQVKMTDDTYRVFEHKTDHTLMTTPSLALSVAPGVAEGATLGLVKPPSKEDLHRAAAQQYMNQTGRANCLVQPGRVLAGEQYEFPYTCT
ncbi:hypothetical protein [Rhizobium leguminosarum]